MSNVKVVLNKEGVRELLKSQEVMNECKKHASDIAERAGEGYEVSTYTGKNRANARVRAATPHAYYSNLKHNTLLKALK